MDAEKIEFINSMIINSKDEDNRVQVEIAWQLKCIAEELRNPRK